MALRNWFKTRKPQRVKRASTTLTLLSLEDRAVPAVGLGSALSVGSETTGGQAKAVAVDALGNSYITGSFGGTWDFDPAASHPDDTDLLTARGITDIYVAKYAPDNSLVWARRMGGDSPSSLLAEMGTAVEVDSEGNVYVGGSFREQADFGTINLTSAGHRDAFVTKLNTGGTFLWAKRWGTVQMEQADNLTVDAFGNVTVVSNNAILYSESSYSPSGSQVQKFNTDGMLQWSQSQAKNHKARDIAADPSGNLYVAGSFSGTVDFDPGTKKNNVTGGPNDNTYVLKLKTNGAFEWVAPFISKTSSASSTGWAIDVNASGAVAVTGGYTGAVDFNPGSATTLLPYDTASTSRRYIAKLSSSGALSWAKGLDTGMMTWDIAIDTGGSIYTTGTFAGTIDFDPDTGTAMRTSNGGNDTFALKLTSAGMYDWVTTFGSSGDENGWGLAVSTTGDVFLCGSFRNTVDFDPEPDSSYELNAGQSANLYLVRLTQS